MQLSTKRSIRLVRRQLIIDWSEVVQHEHYEPRRVTVHAEDHVDSFYSLQGILQAFARNTPFDNRV